MQAHPPGGFKVRPARRRRTIAVLVGLILVGVGLVGTVVALGTLFSEAKQMSIFGQSVRSSDFSLQKLDPPAKGKNRLDVGVTLRNDDAASARSAHATVQVLSVAGDVTAE